MGPPDSPVVGPVTAVAAALRNSVGPICVGFSGGLDSTVLLHATAQALRGRPAATVVALHVNHGLQPQADAWEAHCAAVAAAFGVPFTARRVQVSRSGSLEAAARAARYAVFAEYTADAHARLLLAHHRDDQAETVVLRLLQGRGLYGMPAERRLGDGRLLRPLLGLPRSLLERHARAHGLVWLEDPSNADPSLDRNFVRHRVLPALRARETAIDAVLLAAVAQRSAQDERLVRASADRLARSAVELDWLLALSASERLQWLRLWLTAHGLPVPSRRALRALLDQLGGDRGGQPRLALERGDLRRHRGQLWIVPPLPDELPAQALGAPGCLKLPHGQLAVVADPAGFACIGSLEVRFRRGGERLLVRGRHRSLKHLLQEHAVPPWLRPLYPLVYDGAGLVAVPGIARRDDDAVDRGDARPRYRVTWRPAEPFR